MTNLPDRSGPSVTPEMRAGDADRERVAQVLRDAAGDGRIALEDLDRRLSPADAAPTHADLAALARGPPAPGASPLAPAPAGAADSRPVEGAPRWRTGCGIMRGLPRAAVWSVCRRF